MAIAQRLGHVARTRARAYRLGAFFLRTRDFRLPTSIRLHGRRHPVSFPDERGVRVAFLEVLVDDGYGIRSATPRTILDIGANVGVFCLAARDAHPEAVIHAYEPNRALEPYLRIQARAAGCDYFLEAVSAGGDRMALDAHPDSVRTRAHLDPQGDVPGASLRTAVERLGGTVDFAKIDCEGGEWDLFTDAEAWTRIGQVAMEYHLIDGRRHDDAARELEALGFTVTLHEPAAPEFGMVHARRRS